MFNVFFMSNSIEYSTPQWLFNKLDQEFNFTIDVCASLLNHKCNRFYSIFENGLSKSWKGEIVWCNPPYGKDIKKWVEKCSIEYKINHTLIVCLIPANTETIWFQDYVAPYCEIRFIRGRLHFNDSKNTAPFSSIIAIYNGNLIHSCINEV